MRGRWTPEAVAALVNGLLVFAAPVVLAVYAETQSTAVRPEGWPQTRTWLAGILAAAAVAAPFGMVAAWRTWVHAHRRRTVGGRPWAGVLEAGALGLALALVVLLPGILTRPLDAPPYVIAYGGAASILGLAVGLVLHGSAVVVLHLTRHAST